MLIGLLIVFLKISTDRFRTGDFVPCSAEQVLVVPPHEVVVTAEEVVCCCDDDVVEGIKLTLILVGVGGAVNVLST